MLLCCGFIEQLSWTLLGCEAMTQKSFPGELADSESGVKKAILQKGKEATSVEVVWLLPL